MNLYYAIQIQYYKNKFLLNLVFSAASDRNVRKDMKEIQKV